MSSTRIRRMLGGALPARRVREEKDRAIVTMATSRGKQPAKAGTPNVGRAFMGIGLTGRVGFVQSGVRGCAGVLKGGRKIGGRKILRQEYGRQEY
jgi:hypothetical protein